MKSIHALAWSPDGCRLASAGNCNQIHIWNLDQNSIINTLQAKTSNVRSLSWSATNQRLACGQGDWKTLGPGHVQVWQAATGQELWAANEDYYGAYSVCFAPNGQWLASGHGSGVTVVWYAETGRKYITTSVRDDIRNLINGICFSADSRYIAYGTCYEDGLYIFGLDGTVLQEVVFPKQESWVDFEHAIVFSPNGEWVARGSQAGHVSLWKVDDPLLTMDFVGHQAATYAIDWSPNGRCLAAGSRLGYIKIWDVKSEQELITVTHRPLHALRYSPDARWLASGGDDSTICIWDADPASATFGQCCNRLKA